MHLIFCFMLWLDLLISSMQWDSNSRNRLVLLNQFYGAKFYSPLYIRNICDLGLHCIRNAVPCDKFPSQN